MLLTAACAVSLAILGCGADVPGDDSAAADSTSAMVGDTVTFGRFGTVTLYRPTATPTSTVLFVSGDGGWNLEVVSMARALADDGALVIGIDIRHFLASFRESETECEYAAADFEALSQFVQLELRLPEYLPPVLVGYSSGATLVYAVLAQAPPSTFRSAVSLGFCPDLETARPLCRDGGLRWRPGSGADYTFEPGGGDSLPWTVLHGTIDQVCSADSARAFVARVPGAEIEALPDVGHGFSVERRWMPQLRDAVRRLSARSDDGEIATVEVAVHDLPLVLHPPTGRARHGVFAVVLSGDGGWAGLDREVAAVLVDSGVPVVGWNSLSYFWEARTPQGVAADLDRVIRHFADAWRIDRVALVGYSRGADVLPFAANLLPPDLRSRIALIALISPETHAGFQFHAIDLVRDVRRPTDRDVAPEIERLGWTRVLCFYGTDETDTGCRALPRSAGTVVPITGGHHLGGQYREIGDRIVGAVDGR